MTSELRMKLWKTWNRNKRAVGLAPEWEDFKTFCQWAVANGVEIDSKLLRINCKKTFGPQNIRITTLTAAEQAARHTTQMPKSREKSWNVAVQSFRRALDQASEQAKLKLVERITTGSMPPEWNNYLDY